jgi:hypothetical protein
MYLFSLDEVVAHDRTMMTALFQNGNIFYQIIKTRTCNWIVAAAFMGGRAAIGDVSD